MDVIDDQIDVTGRAFLGMTIACARCHDHKFDPIPTDRLLRDGRDFSQHRNFGRSGAGQEDARRRSPGCA